MEIILSIFDKTISQQNLVQIKNQLQYYNKLALTAVQRKQVFSLYRPNPWIRQSLLKRGWIEKLPVSSNYLRHLREISLRELIIKAQPGNEYETMILSKFLGPFPPNFIWIPKNLANNFACATPVRSRIHKEKILNFSRKDGLIRCSKIWQKMNGIKMIHTPRSYELSDATDRSEFIRYFRTTFCINFLKFFVENNSKNSKALFDKFGTIAMDDTVSTAISGISSDIQYHQKNKSLCSSESKDLNWKNFLENALDIMDGNKKFKEPLCQNISLILLNNCKDVLEKLPYPPMLYYEGNRNMWIIKPASLSRGRGISVHCNLYEILKLVENDPSTDYIVQKYIEFPLLVHDRKFDFRSYFLLTLNEGNYGIWIYHNSYFRFCRKKYSCSSLDKAIHLTSTDIQEVLKNKDNSLFSKCNMWSLSDFKQYLKTINKDGIWETKIIPSIKHDAIAIVLASLQENTNSEKSFELFGCDYILTSDFEPVLLEVNASPDFKHSTPAKTKLCPVLQEDLIRVVLDFPKIQYTGDFELVLRFNSI